MNYSSLKWVFLILPSVAFAQTKYFTLKSSAESLLFRWDKTKILNGNVLIEVHLNPIQHFSTETHKGELQVQLPVPTQQGKELPKIKVFHQTQQQGKTLMVKELMVLERPGAVSLQEHDFSLRIRSAKWADTSAILTFDFMHHQEIATKWTPIQCYWSKDDWATPVTDSLLQTLNVPFGSNQSISVLPPKRTGFVYLRVLDSDLNEIYRSEPMRIE